MEILRQTACIVVNLIIVDYFAPLFDCMTVSRFSSQSVSDGSRLTINACARAHRSLVRGVLVFWPLIAIQTFGLFQGSFSDYKYFTVMFHKCEDFMQN